MKDLSIEEKETQDMKSMIKPEVGALNEASLSNHNLLGNDTSLQVNSA